MTETKREEHARRIEERWQKTKDDAIALKRDRPELVVNVPALLLGPDTQPFVEQFARMAERGDSFTAPHVARGAVFYTTCLGRLHRVIVEDMEPDLRGGAVPALPICTTCNDSHVMTLSRGGRAEQVVACTRCPVPCEACRQRTPGQGAGAFCATTPCACACHRQSGFGPYASRTS